VIEVLRIEGLTATSSTPGYRVLRLKYEYQNEEAVKKLIVDIGRYVPRRAEPARCSLVRRLTRVTRTRAALRRFRKRTRAYRSRRYQLKSTNDVADAISLVKAELGSKITSSTSGTQTNWMINRSFISPKSMMVSPPSPIRTRRVKAVASSGAIQES